MEEPVIVEKTISQDLSEAQLDVLDTFEGQSVSDKPSTPLRLSRRARTSSDASDEDIAPLRIRGLYSDIASEDSLELPGPRIEISESSKEDQALAISLKKLIRNTELSKDDEPSDPGQVPSAEHQDQDRKSDNLIESKTESALATAIAAKILASTSTKEPWPELIHHLLATIRKLEEENRRLAKAPAPDPQPDPISDEIALNESESKDELTESFTFTTFHKVLCDEGSEYYRDVPRKFKDDLRHDHLRGRDKMVNGSNFLAQNPRVVFAVVVEYNCEEYVRVNTHSKLGMIGGRLIRDAPLAEPVGRHIMVGPAVQAGIKAIIAKHPDRFEGYNPKGFGGWWPEPYLLFYAHNKTFLSLADSSELNENQRVAVRMLCEWFEENWRKDWDECDDMLARGKINKKHYRKLFRPNDLVVSKYTDDPTILFAEKIKPFPWKNEDDDWADVFSWAFNGKFMKKERRFKLSLDIHSVLGIGKHRSDGGNDTDHIEVDITSLPCYPLRYNKEGLHDRLSARGEKLWMCKTKRLVCYSERDISDPSTMESRFMVDYDIFKRMHRNNAVFALSGEELDKAKMDASEPPGDDFLVLLPSHVHAFNLQTKTWVQLRVDRMTNVTWNKKAFKQLVIPDETKDFVQALVTAQTQKMGIMNDIMAGKGNGLLILLHGPPGTGKTLTAESIAEVEERPLYRITCGDIGERPADVEAYLSAALEIGKAWGCVVLLDEADVFIEERSLKDLSRNALISVFLRVLEYYDGILILTTNRVGIFDEAFKSRIQLALHYPNLDQVQRRGIWLNFFSMLRGSSSERVDVHDLEMNVEKLATIDINGRQIRNAVTMARHLAKFRKERFNYGHMQKAIETITKFDEYLVELKGTTDENLARESQYR